VCDDIVGVCVRVSVCVSVCVELLCVCVYIVAAVSSPSVCPPVLCCFSSLHLSLSLSLCHTLSLPSHSLSLSLSLSLRLSLFALSSTSLSRLCYVALPPCFFSPLLMDCKSATVGGLISTNLFALHTHTPRVESTHFGAARLFLSPPQSSPSLSPLSLSL
jgi:hypothetical protein